MGNSIIKSVLFLILSTLIISITYLYLTGIYSLSSLYQIFLYILKRYCFFIILLSQFIFVLSNKRYTNSDLVIFTLISFVLYILVTKFVPLVTIPVSQLENNNLELFIDRGDLLTPYSLFSNSYFKSALDILNRWKFSDYFLISSFVIFFFNISFLSAFKRNISSSSLLKTVVFILVNLIILIYWNYSISLALIICSFVCLKSYWRVNENY